MRIQSAFEKAEIFFQVKDAGGGIGMPIFHFGKTNPIWLSLRLTRPLFAHPKPASAEIENCCVISQVHHNSFAVWHDHCTVKSAGFRHAPAFSIVGPAPS